MTDPANVEALRIGIVRPDRPHRAVADAEARVLQTELDRRLGPTVIDLRVSGTDLGRWRSREHAAWPADVDVEVDATRLWGDDLPALTSLFARTVEPAAADVRRRMLRHLGVLPIDHVDDAVVAAWFAGPMRPTDLWLAVSEARVVDISDRAVAGFRGGAAASTELDDALDQLVAGLPNLSDELVGDRLRRSEGRARDAERRAAEHAAELVRVQREVADLLDETNERLAIAEERAERAQLGGDRTTTATSTATSTAATTTTT